MSPLYSSIDQSNFLTSYSATNAYDDFAEGTAFWAASFYHFSYVITLPTGEHFDLLEKYRHSLAYQPKREWLENFYGEFAKKQKRQQIQE